jgi:hypothetical protein
VRPGTGGKRRCARYGARARARLTRARAGVTDPFDLRGSRERSSVACPLLHERTAGEGRMGGEMRGRSLRGILWAAFTCACVGPEPLESILDLNRRAVRLVGHYAGAPGAPGTLVWLDLRLDGTYRAAVNAVCTRGPCEPSVETGRWAVSVSHLVIGAARFEYALAREANGSQTLTLSRDAESQSLRAEAPRWCAAARCVPGYECCNESCGICAPPGAGCDKRRCEGGAVRVEGSFGAPP